MKIKRLKKILEQQLDAVTRSKSAIDQARCVGNLTDKVLRAYRVELEYRRLRKDTSSMPDLD